MANTVDTDCKLELIELIHQFLSNQIASDSQLGEATKESLTVAVECIEQSYKIQKREPSNKLLEIYKASKQGGNSTTGTGENPVEMLRNLANNILFQNSAATSQNQASGPAPSSSKSPSAPTETSQTKTPDVRKELSREERLKAELLKNQGNDLMKEDKYAEAFEHYTNAIKIDTNNAIYYSNRAAASSKLGNHQAALEDCQEAIKIDSTYSKAYGRMGLAYASLDDHKRAKEAYLKAVELDPHNEGYRNNLKIAEEKLSGGAAQDLGGLANELAGLAGGQENITNMLRSVMGNPELVQMAVRSLQDPRVQNLFGNLAGGAGGRGAGAGGQT